MGFCHSTLDCVRIRSLGNSADGWKLRLDTARGCCNGLDSGAPNQDVVCNKTVSLFSLSFYIFLSAALFVCSEYVFDVVLFSVFAIYSCARG